MKQITPLAVVLALLLVLTIGLGAATARQAPGTYRLDHGRVIDTSTGEVFVYSPRGWRSLGIPSGAPLLEETP